MSLEEDSTLNEKKNRRKITVEDLRSFFSSGDFAFR